MTTEEGHEADIFVDNDDKIKHAWEYLKGMDLTEEDGNYRIDTYCEVVSRLSVMYDYYDSGTDLSSSDIDGE